MKITFLGQNDPANVLTEYSYCLNTHSDMQSKSICLWPHGFKYHIQHDYDLHSCNTEQISEAIEWIRNSDVIIFSEEHIGIYNGVTIQNNYTILKYVSDIIGFDIISSDIDLYIWHPGSNYRNRYQYYNNHLLRNRIKGHLYALDLYYLSPKNNNDIPLHTYQYYDFDYDIFITKFKQKLNKTPRTILHIPSNSNVKGTSIINQCVKNSNLNSNQCVYKTINNISNKQVLLEKENSLFYIDQVNPMGGYGVAMVEALFRSNLTFCTTHNITDAIIKLTGINEIPVVSLPEDPQEITKLFEYFFKMSNDELLKIMKGIGQWIDIQYNPKNIVEHFKHIINE